MQVPDGGRQRTKVAGVVLLGLPLVAAVVLVAGRVGATARFVAWPVAVFTALVATVALVGGDHHYAYACVDGRLTRFERVD